MTVLRSGFRALALPLGGALLGVVVGCPGPLPPPRCGDGNVDPGETCDDQNALIGDGCNVACQVEPDFACQGEPSVCRSIRCGDRVVEGAEACDSGGVDSASCNANCTMARCGDRITNAAADEECDDGNVMSGDGCAQDCLREPPTCGNGVCEPGAPVAETCTNCMVDCMAEPMCNGCMDRDEDGYYSAACGGNDCADNDPDVHPDADEVQCNGQNDDCDPATVDAVDEDGDGFNCNLDCNDESALAFPGNPRGEICGDSVDNDCNPASSEAGDMDGDGFPCATDCNDSNADIRPGATEVCNNGVNDDCDRSADGMRLAMPTPDVFDRDGDGAFCNTDCFDDDPARRTGPTLFYPDVDRDGRGAGAAMSFCMAPMGWVSLGGDCDDMNAMRSPALTEVPCDGIDNDCSTSSADRPDVDRDGLSCEMDCNDADATVNTMARERCGDGVDNDCRATTSDAVVDADSDTFSCVVDCDDSNATVFPNAMGLCGTVPMFTEDFETCPTTWTTAGTGSSWACGTPSGTFISRAAGGTRAWVTNLAGDYNSSENSFLVSPEFDLTTATADPVLTFDQIFSTESCCDEGWVDMSVDGGMTWTRLGRQGVGANWYNNSSNYWSGTSGSAGAWRSASVTMTGAAGRRVRIRFALSTDGSVENEGFGVDNVRIGPGAADLALESLTITRNECAAGTDAFATMVIRNVGAIPVERFETRVVVGADPVITTAHALAVYPGASRTVVLPIRAVAISTVAASITATNDSNSANDARSATFTPLADPAPMLVLVPAAGWTEGFESGTGGFTASGTSSSWARGVPAGMFISRAAEGTNAWVTNLTGNYNTSENSFVTSPCLDMRGWTTDPVLAFQHIYETESCCDEGWIDYWTATTGWQRLDPGLVNWHTNRTSRWWNGSSGDAGAWREASARIPGAAGQIIRFRHGFSADGSGQEDGFGIDAVSLRP